MEDKELKKLFKKFKFLKKKTLPEGIKCEAGWNTIINNMLQSISDSNPPDTFIITKIFSKISKLNVYTSGGNNTTRFAIEEAIELSEDTCEFCGNLKELQMCEKCKDPEPVVETAVPTATP
ncbi:MAG: hypothetical protein WC523_04475 [Patescibacteria group bacterium]